MKYESKWHIIFNVIRIAFVFIACLAVGYVFSLFLFWIFGTPPPFFTYIISALTGVLLFGFIARILSTVVLKGHNDGRQTMLHETVDAMDKIAHGDFNISVKTYDHDPFFEVAESVNKMARELGALEIMRQDFISNVSHEIQSPLTSISGFAALMKTESLTEEERKHYLDIIETESRRLSKLSDNLLKLSALNDKPLEKSEYRLDKQVSAVILTLEPQWMAKNLTVEANLQACVIKADEALLLQVWVNLLHNAIKFTPKNGRITVSLIDNTVCVTDSGIGIIKDDLPHIFERFYKVDKSRDRSLGGNGLGLSLVKKIVELHSGEITVKSEIYKGTVFEIILPHQNIKGE